MYQPAAGPPLVTAVVAWLPPVQVFQFFQYPIVRGSPPGNELLISNASVWPGCTVNCTQRVSFV